MNLYQDEILDHYKHPRNKKRITDATMSSESSNPLCGDTLGLEIKVENGKIAEVGFWGEGCAISQASMSMITDELLGQEASALSEFSQKDILDLLGVSIGPSRLKCALLPLNIIHKLAIELH
ncbi:MAG: SUF system NifU family Fe-S cluster assembly protein [bacterium]|nr:SUF system NifU family Fe-S cluster assembly protein [bacterium]